MQVCPPSGGFIGVDVFFVISGFLITGIITREIDVGSFSIVHFYERRVRRIVPALFFVMIFVLVAAWWLYLPKDFASVGRSVIAALAFCANINFWHGTDYFAAPAREQPMLHTWSLAVEEQFYIAFPLLLLVAARWMPQHRRALLWTIFVVSLGFCIWQTQTSPVAAFYLPASRAWELATGALLAVGAVPAIRERVAREFVAWAGLSAIVLTAVLLNETTPFPGAVALAPVLGTAALLHCAERTSVGRLLSTPPMIGIGLISYSLYLWHWPIIVFMVYARDMPLGGVSFLLAIALSLIMAVLSWRFVERPYRTRTKVSRGPLFTQAAIGAVLIGGIAGAIYINHGVRARWSPDLLHLADGANQYSPLRQQCHVDVPGDLNHAPCVLGAPVAPTTILWGDSHGAELAYALGESAARHHAAIVEATASACVPLTGLSIGPLCDEHNRRTIAFLKNHPEIKTVVLAAFWSDPANARLTGLPAALSHTVDQLRAMGRRVIFVRDEPPQTFDVPRRLVHLAQQGRLQQEEGRTRAAANEMTAYLHPTFRRLRAEGVTMVDPKDALCRGNRCDIYRDGQSLYIDYHHVSMTGARLVATLIEPILFGDGTGGSAFSTSRASDTPKTSS